MASNISKLFRGGIRGHQPGRDPWPAIFLLQRTDVLTGHVHCTWRYGGIFRGLWGDLPIIMSSLRIVPTSGPPSTFFATSLALMNSTLPRSTPWKTGSTRHNVISSSIGYRYHVPPVVARDNFCSFGVSHHGADSTGLQQSEALLPMRRPHESGREGGGGGEGEGGWEEEGGREGGKERGGRGSTRHNVISTSKTEKRAHLDPSTTTGTTCRRWSPTTVFAVSALTPRYCCRPVQSATPPRLLLQAATGLQQ